MVELEGTAIYELLVIYRLEYLPSINISSRSSCKLWIVNRQEVVDGPSLLFNNASHELNTVSKVSILKNLSRRLRIDLICSQ